MKLSTSRLVILLLSCLIFGFGIMKGQTAEASITTSGSTYTVTSGDDLFNLLTNNKNYWSSQNVPPTDLTIKVANTITLPGYDASLYSGLTNVKVDFQQHQFYAGNYVASRVLIPKTSSAQLTVANVNNTSNATTNQVTGVPNSAGTGTATSYLSTYYGMLFSSDFGLSAGTTSCAAQVTYDNVVYNMPNNLVYNQPLCTYFVPINFTGKNKIVTAVSGQQVGEIANLKVSSGTTEIIGGDGSSGLAGGMFYPYYNNLNQADFPIDVAKGATLTLTNKDARAPMFAFIGIANSVTINNQGTLNLNATSAQTTLFGSGTKGVTLNASAQANTNISTAGAAFSNDMGTTKFIGNFADQSRTVLSSATSVFKNSSAWKNNSSLNVTAGAKIAAYSGGTQTGGLTDSSSHYIPVTFNGGSMAQGFLKPSASSTTDDYTGLEPADSKFNAAGSTVNSNDLTNANNKGLLISAELLGTDLGAVDQYKWDYNIADLSEQPTLLPRTTGNDLYFRVIDTRSATPSFSVMASYTPAETQPFTMWFKNDQSAVQLSPTDQTVLSADQMTADNGVYTKTFDENTGLLLKASIAARAGSYTGKVVWTLVDGVH